MSDGWPTWDEGSGVSSRAESPAAVSAETLRGQTRPGAAEMGTGTGTGTGSETEAEAEAFQSPAKLARYTSASGQKETGTGTGTEREREREREVSSSPAKLARYTSASGEEFDVSRIRTPLERFSSGRHAAGEDPRIHKHEETGFVDRPPPQGEQGVRRETGSGRGWGSFLWGLARSVSPPREEAVRIFYRVVRSKGALDTDFARCRKYLMVMGLAAASDAWEHQVRHLCGDDAEVPTVCVCLDNRGCGRSSAPRGLGSYSTATMAEDAKAVLDALGWSDLGGVHLVGFSMGGMVCAKVASRWPACVASLALVCSGPGGYHALPTLRSLPAVLQLGLARDAESRVKADLAVHFSPKYTRNSARYRALVDEYRLRSMDGPEMPGHGMLGQLWAVWTHRVTEEEGRRVRRAKIPTLVVHGRWDRISHYTNAVALADQFRASLVVLQAAHMVPFERAPELARLLGTVASGTDASGTTRDNFLEDFDPIH